MLHKPIEQRNLVRMQQSIGFLEPHELGAINFPACTLRLAVVACSTDERVNSFSATAVLDETDREKCPSLNACLFPRFATCGILQILS